MKRFDERRLKKTVSCEKLDVEYRGALERIVGWSGRNWLECSGRNWYTEKEKSLSIPVGTWTWTHNKNKWKYFQRSLIQPGFGWKYSQEIKYFKNYKCKHMLRN